MPEIIFFEALLRSLLRNLTPVPLSSCISSRWLADMSILSFWFADRQFTFPDLDIPPDTSNQCFQDHILPSLTWSNRSAACSCIWKIDGITLWFRVTSAGTAKFNIYSWLLSTLYGPVFVLGSCNVCSTSWQIWLRLATASMFQFRTKNLILNHHDNHRNYLQEQKLDHISQELVESVDIRRSK